MITLGAVGAQICIVGRTNFRTGIGAIAYGTAETLARSFPVAFRPIEPTDDDGVTLPNGRRLPILPPGAQPAASIFCDVIWNGERDHAWDAIPQTGLVHAWLLFDSDRLPPRFVERLNARADTVLVPSPHLDAVARASGVTRPITTIPIPLDLDRLLCLAPAPSPRFTFGAISAFHPRKGHETLVDAFLARFAGDPTTQLVLHSNLAFGPTLDHLRARTAVATNIRITTGDLAEAERDALIASVDAFVSCSHGEGYGIGPREALAAGKQIIASAVGGHLDLAGIQGVHLVPPSAILPAHYPEIDGLTFGTQHAVSAADIAAALSAARAFDPAPTALARRLAARQWSFAGLAPRIGALIDPSIAAYRAVQPPSPNATPAIERRLGRRGDAVGGIRRQVCPAYDGGFFSVFNAFISHLVWQERDDRCHAVFPDWDIDRFLAYQRREGLTTLSFCYGQPGDGNLWLRLFQPLFGATEAEMQDEAFLWRHAEAPADRHNEDREPHLTYSRAYTMYRSPHFAGLRRQYHRVIARHVRLRPEIQAEIDAFAAAHLDVPVRIAAHVRHPSHTIEQPGGKIAHTEAYISRVREEVIRRGADPGGPGWAVFVATDQDRVLARFHEAFGSRAVFYPEARRTRADEDAAFDALTPEEQSRDGHQLQHLVAADPASWNWRMAYEVVRDAYTMARCQALLHVVSNVSTAVATMNPELEMIFCEA